MSVPEKRSRAAICGLFRLPRYLRARCLSAAYAEQQAHLAGFTDDAAVVEACGATVYVAPGDYGNMKITTPRDLAFAQWQVQRSDGDG